MAKQRKYRWVLLAKHLSCECNEGESKELQKILIDNPDFKATADILSSFWHTRAIKNTETPESLWDRHVQRMNKKKLLYQ